MIVKRVTLLLFVFNLFSNLIINSQSHMLIQYISTLLQTSHGLEAVPLLLTPEHLGDFVVDIANVRIAEEIGRGAFGVVHRGIVQNLEHGELRTEVALKWSKGKHMPPISLCRVNH